MTKPSLVAEMNLLSNSPDPVFAVCIPALYSVCSAYGMTDIEEQIFDIYKRRLPHFQFNDEISLHLLLRTWFDLPSRYYRAHLKSVEEQVMRVGASPMNIKLFNKILARSSAEGASGDNLSGA